MRLIDANELKIDYGFTWDDITPTHDEMYALIDRQPTIEERKKGKWRIVTPESYRVRAYRCSECNELIYGKTNYCPGCGADMRQEGEEK